MKSSEENTDGSSDMFSDELPGLSDDLAAIDIDPNETSTDTVDSEISSDLLDLDDLITLVAQVDSLSKTNYEAGTIDALLRKYRRRNGRRTNGRRKKTKKNPQIVPR